MEPLERVDEVYGSEARAVHVEDGVSGALVDLLIAEREKYSIQG